jgi:magnesium-transporting ATPase (P-type)
LEFQLTINFSVVTIVFISGCTLGKIPFNVVQLLWINLIMDILAAISLGTEPITERDIIPEANKETRISRAAKVFQARIWKNILIQGTYQIVVILTLMYFGTLMFFTEPYNLVTEQTRSSDGEPSNLMVMNTMIFLTFILMNMFNQINCRVGDYLHMSFLAFLTNNLIFWLVLIFEILLTHFMLGYAANWQFGCELLGLTKISMLQYILAWVFGVLSVPLYIVTNKFIKDGAFMSLMTKFDLEQEIEMKKMDKAKNFFKSSTTLQGTED